MGMWLRGKGGHTAMYTPCVKHASLPIYDNSLFSWIACCQSAFIPMSQVGWVSHSGLTWHGVGFAGGTDALAIEVGMKKQGCGTMCVGARSAACQGRKEERHQTGLFRMCNKIPVPCGFNWGKADNKNFLNDQLEDSVSKTPCCRDYPCELSPMIYM